MQKHISGDKREHTQIIPETEYIALTDNNYIPLTQAQISLCAKIGYMYYCEYAHLLRNILNIHACQPYTTIKKAKLKQISVKL